jgi:hypothetical protein
MRIIRNVQQNVTGNKTIHEGSRNVEKDIFFETESNSHNDNHVLLCSSLSMESGSSVACLRTLIRKVTNQLTKMYWLLGRKSKLSTNNKLLIYKAIQRSPQRTPKRPSSEPHGATRQQDTCPMICLPDC